MIGYILAVNEEEDGMRVTGTSGICFLGRGRLGCEEKEQKKEEKGEESKKSVCDTD